MADILCALLLLLYSATILLNKFLRKVIYYKFALLNEKHLESLKLSKCFIKSILPGSIMVVSQILALMVLVRIQAG